MSLLKEECQAFGVVVSQSISKKDACVNPTISVPLAALTPEGELRQSDEFSRRNFLLREASDEFSRRNFLLREANAIKHIHAEDTTWLVDGLAAVRASKPCKTFREWINIFIKYMLAAPHIPLKEFVMANYA